MARLAGKGRSGDSRPHPRRVAALAGPPDGSIGERQEVGDRKERTLLAVAIPPALMNDWLSLPPQYALAGTVAGAIAIALLALFVAARARQGASAILRKRSTLDPGLALLSGRLAYFAILVVAALWILSLFGIPLTAPLTVLGAVGLAVSLALQDVLRNLFAGLYLLVERPFTLGDLIEVKGVSGRVLSVELRLTVLSALDGRQVTVPNATVFTEVIVNRSARPAQRQLLLITLPPGTSDLEPVTNAVRTAAGRIGLNAPEPVVAVQAATAKGVLVQAQVWAPDEAALGQVILDLRRALPGAAVSVPGTPALAELPKEAAKPRRISRTRPARARRRPLSRDR